MIVLLKESVVCNGGALQFSMKIRYRELKRAFMNNQDDNFMDFFHSVYFKLFIATSGRLSPDFGSPSSKRPGISKHFEPGKPLGHTGILIAARKPNLVFPFFSV